MPVNPTKFLRDVRNEAKKVTWPTRRTTLMTTAAVLAMAAGASAFFFIVDQAIGYGIQILFGLGG
ncbi:preprotein translocase subunit SecE [Commensalibacter oyaizuii]|uniref:Protein translocase subunit SecE n=1 Tax=Commensalibacter oyaizuii TaxID=3043873 RepID=A0ABT6Q1L5_9PROT|nr:preprotein translocase subunit SecE [Commensalibacter sp. TBRC 16381]MDI2090990.1 preprotein translocase subunit SecE [Commensalibacter sp. TBRC 16381]